MICLYDIFLSKLIKYTLQDESLAPLIRKQAIATYYKYSGDESDERSILLRKLQEIENKTTRQKGRVEKEEIPYELFLEFKAGYEKEKKEIEDVLAKEGKGVSNPGECIDFA
jgi:hypothetical protein